MQFVHVNVFHQRLLGHQHCFFSRAANAYAQHARWAPASAHGGHGFEHPVNDRVAGVEHDQFRFVLRTAAFGCDGDIQLVARDDLNIDDRRRVVFGVFAVKLWVAHDGGTQRVVRVVVALAHAFVDGVVYRARKTIKPYIHANFEEHVDDARVLANRAVARRTHAAVGQNLRDRVFGGRAFLSLIRSRQMGDVVGRVVVADVLKCTCNGFDQVGLFDVGGHGENIRKNFCLDVQCFAALSPCDISLSV